MSKKYRNPTNTQDAQIAKMLPEKLGIHIYKTLFYACSSLYGYKVLKNEDYFPPSCFGKGEMKNIFKAGYPNLFYHNNSPEFVNFYMIGGAYYLGEFLFFVFSQEMKRNDVPEMILHHICAIGLIAFSYITNYTHIGAIILFYNVLSDIPNHILKLLLKLEVPDYVPAVQAVIFLFIFSFYRMYVHGQVVYTIYFYANWKWEGVTLVLFNFLIILLVLQIFWCSVIFISIVQKVLKLSVDDYEHFQVEDKDNKTLGKKTN